MIASDLKIVCYAILILGLTSTANGARPELRPPFKGDFFFLKADESTSVPCEVLSTEMKIRIVDRGKNDFRQLVFIDYEVRNESQENSIEIAIIADDCDLNVRHDPISFKRTYLDPSELPIDVQLAFATLAFDRNNLVTVNVFELPVLPGESIRFSVFYGDNGGQSYDDRGVSKFSFWFNPELRGVVTTNFGIDEKLKSQALLGLQGVTKFNAELSEFEIENKRDQFTSGVLAVEFPLRNPLPRVARAFPTGVKLAENIDWDLISKSSIYIFGVVTGVFGMALTRLILGIRLKRTKTSELSQTHALDD